jgi:hypothetical protein
MGTPRRKDARSRAKMTNAANLAYWQSCIGLSKPACSLPTIFSACPVWNTVPAGSLRAKTQRLIADHRSF